MSDLTPEQGRVLEAIRDGRLPGPGARSPADEEAVTALAVLGFIRWSGHSWDVTQTGRDALRAYLSGRPPADETPESRQVTASLDYIQRAYGSRPPDEAPPEGFVTRSGKVLSAADLDALADEAERGYDVSQLHSHQIAPQPPAAALGMVLAGLPRRLQEHQAANPSHGDNCACLDEYIAAVRAAARRLYQSGPEGRLAIERLSYVLHAALDTRWLA